MKPLAAVIAVALVMAAIVLWPRLRGGGLGIGRTETPVIAVVGPSDGAVPADRELAEASLRALREALGDDDRVIVMGPDEAARANVVLEARLALLGDRLALQVLRKGTSKPIVAVDGPALMPLVQQAARAALAWLEVERRPARAPTPDEARRMRDLGTASFPAFRHLQRGMRILARKTACDTPAGLRSLDAAAAADPGFARAALSRASMESSEKAARPWLERADDAARKLPAEHPARQVVSAYLASVQRADVQTPLTSYLSAHPDDFEAAWYEHGRLFRAGAIAEVERLDRGLALRFPELQFGGNLVEDLRLLGRVADAEAFAADWARRAPESPDSLTTLALQHLLAGRTKEAADAMARAVLVHGAGSFSEELAVMRIAEERWSEARTFAEILARSSPIAQVAGHYLLGWLAIAEGRLAEAQRELDEAARLAVTAGADAPIVQPVRAQADLLHVRGDHDAELQALVRGSADAEAAHEWEIVATFALRAARLRGAAGALEDAERLATSHLEGSVRAAALTELRREAAALRGDCTALRALGPSTARTGEGSLLALGRCLREAGQLVEARRVLARLLLPQALVDRALPSPAYAILARYELGAVADAAGDGAAARDFYARFLRAWEKAEPPVARTEVARARARLDALAAGP